MFLFLFLYFLILFYNFLLSTVIPQENQRFNTHLYDNDLPNAKDVNLKLEPEGKFFFSATSGVDKIPYEINIDPYEKVDVNVGSSSIIAVFSFSHI